MENNFKPIGFIKKDGNVIHVYNNNDIINMLSNYYTNDDELMKMYKDNWENNSNILILFQLND